MAMERNPHQTDRDRNRDADREQLLLMGQLTEATKQTSQLVRELMQTTAENQRSIAQCLALVDQYSKTLGRLEHVVRDGNGTSLMTRMEVMAGEVRRLQKWQEDFDEEVESREQRTADSQEEHKRTVMSGWYQIGAAVLSGLLVAIQALMAWLSSGHVPKP